MVKIKGEIDLRSAEFIASRRLFKPVLLKFLAIVLLILIILGTYCGGSFYADNLRSDLLNEEAGLEYLRNEVSPLLMLIDDNALLEAKFSLKKDIRLLSKPLPQYLHSIREKAAASRIIITTTTIDKSGNLFIAGKCRVLEHISLFNKDLNELPFVLNAGVIFIDMVKENEYLFEITGIIDVEKRNADHE